MRVRYIPRIALHTLWAHIAVCSPHTLAPLPHNFTLSPTSANPHTPLHYAPSPFADPTKAQRCVMLVHRTVQQLQCDGLVRRCSNSSSNGQLLINRVEYWEWQAANRYVDADTHL